MRSIHGTLNPPWEWDVRESPPPQGCLQAGPSHNSSDTSCSACDFGVACFGVLFPRGQAALAGRGRVINILGCSESSQGRKKLPRALPSRAEALVNPAAFPPSEASLRWGHACEGGRAPRPLSMDTYSRCLGDKEIKAPPPTPDTGPPAGHEVKVWVQSPTP